MDRTRACGCKGRRSCLICEKEFNIPPPVSVPMKNIYIYCHLCGLAWKCSNENSNVHNTNAHPNHEGEYIFFPGVFIQEDFLSDVEKEKLLLGINTEPFTLSQSGRRKQNYGPRCNFKKTKITKRGFFGFPKYSKFVHDKFKSISLLSDFQVIEQCVLEYDPVRGASIDPHIDDCWIWGERIVTVNVLGDTYLTMNKYVGDIGKYNLDHRGEYRFSNGSIPFANKSSDFADYGNATIRIYMPEKSLIVLYGNARYDWEHSVLRNDIEKYRLCIAYREFTTPFITGEHKNIGDEIREIAKQFW